MQSAYHNVPTIGDVMQGAGRKFEARDVSCALAAESAGFHLDLAGAYPPQAGVGAWNRSITLDRRSKRVVIEDRYQLKKPVARIELSLMTAQRPEVAASVSIGGVVLKYDPSLNPVVDEIDVTDRRLHAVWGGKLYRLRLVAERPPLGGHWQMELG
jgi:hypothetical protein